MVVALSVAVVGVAIAIVTAGLMICCCISLRLFVVAVVDEEAFDVAGEHDERLDGTVVNLYSLNRRLSSSLGGDKAIVILSAQ